MSSFTHTGRSDWAGCTKCRLYHTRKNVVIKRIFRHKGGTYPRLMLLGEAPGKTEDATGLPFMGESGRILSLILKEVTPFFGVITNMVGCRPSDEQQNNREPTPAEIDKCKDHIPEILTHYKINGLIFLGNIAARFETRLPHIPIYHPAYIARMEYKYYTIKKQRDLLNDFINGLHKKTK